MNKALVVVALLSTATYGAWRWYGGSHETTDGGKLALDRIWLDHVPTSERDKIQVFVALTEEPVGLFQAASTWTGAYEIFQYKARGNQIQVQYPQTGDRETVTAKAKPCDERGMDYCLELSGSSRGVKRYYSMEGWEVRGQTIDAVEHRVDAILHATH